VAKSIELAKKWIMSAVTRQRASDSMFSTYSEEEYDRNLLCCYKPENVEKTQRAWMRDVISLFDTGPLAKERRKIYWSWFNDVDTRNGCLYAISNSLSSYDSELKELGQRLACIDSEGYEWTVFFFAQNRRGYKLISECNLLKKLEEL